MKTKWTVILSREAAKQREKLNRSGSKPSLIDTIDFLLYDLEENGPVLCSWPNYGIITEKKMKYYHCHLKKGRPTYVACWYIVDEKEKKLEVFYVGTHEDAPY